MTSALEIRLEQILAENADLSDGSHDMSHLRRVKSLALQIANIEKRGNQEILIAAAYLHDLVNLPKSHPDRSKASQLSATAARPIMAGLGMSDTAIDIACQAIEAHSFSAGIEPRSTEAQILQDADRIDALGAIGIARTFYIAGKLSSLLFDPDDAFANGRPLDDKKFALDHFEAKLLKLSGTMKTRGGREIAERRTDFMRRFLDQIREELLADKSD